MSGIFDQIINYSPPLIVSGTVNYKGTWNASTNNPTLNSSPASSTKGDYYVVSTAGTQFGITFAIGDWIISNGTAWEKVDLTDAVSSVFGRTGAVVGVSTDYSAVGLTNTAIGASNPSTGAFTTVTASSTISATGAVTGSNLSGTNTGDQTTITGNAGTATALQTARTIGGSSFNGTANVTSFPVPGAIGVTTPAAANFTSIGVTTQGTGAFTTLSATGDVTLTATSNLIANKSVILSDGTAGTATGAIYFINDTDTGFYRAGGNTLGFMGNGASLGTWSPTGLAVTGSLSTTQSVTATGGFVIGNDNSFLYDSGTGAVTLRLGASGPYGSFLTNSGEFMVDGPSGTLTLGAAGTRVATISSTGLAVTGTLSTLATNGVNVFESAGISSVGLQFKTNSTNRFKIETPSASADLAFYAGGTTEVGRFSSTGLAVTGALSATGAIEGANVIRTNGPATADKAASAAIDYASGFHRAWCWGPNTSTLGQWKIRLVRSDGSAAVEPVSVSSTGLAVTGALTTTGDVGIGTTPGAKLDVKGLVRSSIGTGTGSGGAAYAFYQFGTSATATENWHIGTEGDGSFRFYNQGFGAGIERMRINGSGGVAIGTTPFSDTRFTVVPSGDYAPAITVRSSSSTANWARLDLYNANTAGPLIFGQDNTGFSFIRNDGTDSGISFQTSGGVERAKVSTTGLGVVGALSCTGALSKGSGSFRIEHPLPEKSATHQLVHSFIEGPQADLIYRGKVTLIDGKVSVNIDAAATMTEGTFEVLCRDVQCFVTNNSNWSNVRGTISGNILTIECEDAFSSANVSWMVIGERKDPHMMETDWTDNNGKVIVEPLKPVQPIE